MRRSDIHSMKGCTCDCCEERRARHRAHYERLKADPEKLRRQREAVRRWAQSPEGREYHRAYKQAGRYREGQRAYRASGRGRELNRAAKERFLASPKGQDARRRDDAARRAREADKPKLAARKAVAKAIACGKLVRPAACRCGAPGPLEAHHHRGYARKLRLDVVFLCRDCHRAEEA